MERKTPDIKAQEQMRAHWDALAKPLGSLGQLEEMTIRLAGIQGGMPYVHPRAVAVFAADNGILEEGFNPVPQAVTAAQFNNMAKGVAGISVLCEKTGAGLTLVDVGIASDCAHPAILKKKVAYGTKNMAKGPAMTREQAQAAFDAGVETAHMLAAQGNRIIGIGEMGIGNTSTSSAVISLLCGVSPEETTGRGVGLDDTMHQLKIDAIKRAIDVNKPEADDPMDVLSKVGGLDIAAMAGCYAGAAQEGVACVVDGLISMAAALCAVRLQPDVQAFLFASHASSEPGYIVACRELGLKPVLALDMRLGEGSGCPLLFMLLDAAVVLFKKMARLDTTGLEIEDLIDIR
ncbi:MAG: nicotinate-nucleotide--dimethylbenzimidazole phosphoribosyltransferase [Bacillota bacterium]